MSTTTTALTAAATTSNSKNKNENENENEIENEIYAGAVSFVSGFLGILVNSLDRFAILKHKMLLFPFNVLKLIESITTIVIT